MSEPSSPNSQSKDNSNSAHNNENDSDKNNIQPNNADRQVVVHSEESLTPPLLPNMKIKNVEKVEVKPVKQTNWDMFAEQDSYKANAVSRQN